MNIADTSCASFTKLHIQAEQKPQTANRDTPEHKHVAKSKKVQCTPDCVEKNPNFRRHGDLLK